MEHINELQLTGCVISKPMLEDDDFISFYLQQDSFKLRVVTTQNNKHLIKKNNYLLIKGKLDLDEEADNLEEKCICIAPVIILLGNSSNKNQNSLENSIEEHQTEVNVEPSLNHETPTEQKKEIEDSILEEENEEKKLVKEVDTPKSFFKISSDKNTDFQLPKANEISVFKKPEPKVTISSKEDDSSISTIANTLETNNTNFTKEKRFTMDDFN